MFFHWLVFHFMLCKNFKFDLLNELDLIFNFPNFIRIFKFSSSANYNSNFVFNWIYYCFLNFTRIFQKKRQHTYALLIYFFIGVFQAALSIEKDVLNYILLLVPLTYLICVLLLRIKTKKF